MARYGDSETGKRNHSPQGELPAAGLGNSETETKNIARRVNSLQPARTRRRRYGEVLEWIQRFYWVVLGRTGSALTWNEGKNPARGRVVALERSFGTVETKALPGA
jgi:hypothetical protein